ncbi:6-bladed beta-propeller [Oceanobacillus chungangensis]|uniref:6-bladed beta-propeller n=2 Tax=Oceanobacillus chungangensis TaxID=1229152 RepID=A0A3D8PL61_9BACI|nr:6-bladed beta-propeller [Oceanobacillus chungangensis]
MMNQSVKRLGKILPLILIAFLLFSGSVSAHSVVDIWGKANEGTGVIFNTPVAMAKDASGNIYVSDMSNHRIVKMDQDGNIIKKFGKLGSGNGEFNTPFGVAIDNDGNILVGDTANNRIQKFDSNFNFITAWGSHGSGNGQFGLAREIAIDSQNHYHVTDEFHDRIQVFDQNGTYLYQYGSRGTANGQFRLPQGIAIKQDANGDKVYVVDTFNHRVQILDVNGNYLGQIGVTGQSGDSGSRLFYPRGVNLDTNGDVYIVDTTNHKVKKYNSNHQYQYSTDLGIYYLEPSFPSQVLPLGDGYFIVSDTGNSRLIKFRGYSTYASVQSYLGNLRNADGVFSEPVGIAVDNNDDVYITDTFNHRVQKFDNSGTLLNKWGGNNGDGGPSAYGINYWQFIAPKQITYNGKYNEMVIADTGNSRIQVFSKNGSWLSNFGYYHLSFPMGVTTTSDGYYYVADTGNNRVVNFNPFGVFVSSWGAEGLNNGEFRQPTFITVDSQDNLYVVDRYNSRIQKFDKSGNFITKWGTNGGNPQTDPLDNWGEGNGDLFLPVGIAVDQNDNVYVTDSSNNRVQKFSSNGTYLDTIGQFGGEDHNFFSPQGIAVGANGDIYIADTLLNRVVKFRP